MGTSRINLALFGIYIDIHTVVQSLNCVQLFVTSWTAVYQASLFFTISQSLLKLMSIALVMPSNHLMLCHPRIFLPSLFPRIRFFSPMSRLFASGGQYIHIYMQIFNDSFYTIYEWFSKALTKNWHTGDWNNISIFRGNYNIVGVLYTWTQVMDKTVLWKEILSVNWVRKWIFSILWIRFSKYKG